MDKLTVSWYGVPFWENRDGDSNNAGRADQFFIKERLANKRKGATRMRLLMQSIWEGPQDGSKQYITEKVGDIVLIWIMN